MPDLYEKMVDASWKYHGEVVKAAYMCLYAGCDKWLDKEMERLRKEYDAELDRLQKEAQITDA
jgi:hypothetical protein